jgi:hypothetical protein
VDVAVYNISANEGAMLYTAPSPFDDPTEPIDAQALRAWWASHRNEAQAVEPRKPASAVFGQRR